MNKQEILKKAEAVLEERRRKKQEDIKKYNYVNTCLSAMICPICGENLRSTFIGNDIIPTYNCKNCGVLTIWEFIDEDCK